MLRAGFGANVSGFPTTTGVGSPSRPRPCAAGCWPRLRPLPHPLRCCAGTATSSQPSTMAPRIGVQADLPRRKASVSSWYVWHGRTRHADIRACRAHSRTSDMNLGATPSRGPSPSTVSRACPGAEQEYAVEHLHQGSWGRYRCDRFRNTLGYSLSPTWSSAW